MLEAAKCKSSSYFPYFAYPHVIVSSPFDRTKKPDKKKNLKRKEKGRKKKKKEKKKKRLHPQTSPSSVQFKMASTRSVKHIIMRFRSVILSEVFAALP